MSALAHCWRQWGYSAGQAVEKTCRCLFGACSQIVVLVFHLKLFLLVGVAAKILLILNDQGVRQISFIFHAFLL